MNNSEQNRKSIHLNESSDGREIKNMLIQSFEVNVENFNRSISESEKLFPVEYITRAIDALLNIENWSTSPSEIEIFFLSFVLDIKHDYIKSLQHLLQGFVSDHYFFMRRAIENVQLLLFYKEKIKTEKDFSSLISLGTNEFKKIHKFKKWFNGKENYFKRSYKTKMELYVECCNLGVHASLERKAIMQSFEINATSKTIKINSKFHDGPAMTMLMPILNYRVHLLFWDVTRFIFVEKIFPSELDLEVQTDLEKRLNDSGIFLANHYRNNHPDVFKEYFS